MKCESMTEEELLALPLGHSSLTQHNISYLPTPNIGDVIITNRLAPSHLTPTAFVFQFFPNTDMLFTNNRRRGIEVPGGHRDVINGVLEEPAVAALREGVEETGANHESKVIPVGFMRSMCMGEKPEGYKYPFPMSCQQFFAVGIHEGTNQFVETDECLTPVRLTLKEAIAHFREKRASRLLEEAYVAWEFQT